MIREASANIILKYLTLWLLLLLAFEILGSIGAVANPPFSCGGFVLGSKTTQSILEDDDFDCRDSEDYPGSIWCHKIKRTNRSGKSGTIANTVVVSPDGFITYANEDIEPAFFSNADINNEIARISQRYQLRPQLYNKFTSPSGTTSVLVTWGDISLAPLDDYKRQQIANGRPAHGGILVDRINKLPVSAREGSPIYTIQGGAGFVWLASFDESGTGSLRFFAADPSRMNRDGANSPQLTSPPTLSFSGASPPAPDPVAAAQEQARAQALQQARFDKIAPAAHQLVADASAFIKANASHPRLLEFVEMINALNTAIDEKDVGAIDKKSMALSGALRAEPAYTDLENQRIAEQRRASAQFLGDTIKLGQRQKSFMISYIAKEPTSSAASAFLPLIRQIDPAIARANLSELQALTAKTDIAIREANLNDAFAAWKLVQAPNRSENLKIVATDKNSFLMNGDLGDVVLVMNARSDAPHIAKNLRGEVVFEGSAATACFYQQAVDPELSAIVKTTIRKLGANTIHLSPSCDVAHLEEYDIVAANRGAFLKNDLQSGLALIKPIESDAFRLLSTISAADIKNEADGRAKGSAIIAADVAAGAREGYGVILMKNGAPTLCAVIADKPDGHRSVLVANVDRLTVDMNNDPILASTSVDKAFIQVQRGQCGALYGSARDLKDMDAALTAERIDHHFSSLWFSQTEIDTGDRKATEQKARMAAESTARKRQAEDERKLTAQRVADAASTNAARQSEMRTQFGRSATAATTAIGNELRGFADNHAGAAGQKWPAIVNWLNERLADHWEVMSLESEISDYGVSNWKGRSLDTVFARINVKLKNRMLGEYQDSCFIVGQIADTEFSAVREPFAAKCENEFDFKRWKTANGFVSKWNVE